MAAVGYTSVIGRAEFPASVAIVYAGHRVCRLETRVGGVIPKVGGKGDGSGWEEEKERGELGSKSRRDCGRTSARFGVSCLFHVATAASSRDRAPNVTTG